MNFSSLFTVGALFGLGKADYLPSRVYVNEPALQLTPDLFRNLASAGVTHVIVAFTNPNPSSPEQALPQDAAESWAKLSTKEECKKSGVKIIMSSGGSNGSPSAIWRTANPAQYAKMLMAHGEPNLYDGYDMDFEGGTFAETFTQMIEISKALKQNGAKYLTIAPQVGHFEIAGGASGCDLFRNGVNVLDEVYIQYYNDRDKLQDRETGELPSMDSILVSTHDRNRAETLKTPVKQIIAQCGLQTLPGAPKIVIGRPFAKHDAYTQETTAVEPRELYCTAKRLFGELVSGLMFWSYRSTTNYEEFKKVMSLNGECSATSSGVTSVQQTQAPQTQAPPTQAPPTQAPPTQAPPTQAPPTPAPYTPPTPAPYSPPETPYVAPPASPAGDSNGKIMMDLAADCKQLTAHSCAAKKRGDSSWHDVCKNMCSYAAEPGRCSSKSTAGFMECVKKFHAHDLKCVYGQSCEAGGFVE